MKPFVTIGLKTYLFVGIVARYYLLVKARKYYRVLGLVGNIPTQVRNMPNYANEKKRRDLKYKDQRTLFERSIGEWLKKAEMTNYLLMVIAMILLGVFIWLVLSGL